MAPFYLGLIVALAVLCIKFFIELFQFSALGLKGSDTDLILGVLSLIDIALTGNLVLIVIFSGYENFVSRIDVFMHDRPDWMAKVDFGGLKQKLMTSIVAISAVQVLKAFMNIERYDTTKLGWLVGIHALFLFSMLVVALADKLGESAKPGQEKRHRAKV